MKKYLSTVVALFVAIAPASFAQPRGNAPAAGDKPAESADNTPVLSVKSGLYGVSQNDKDW